MGTSALTGRGATWRPTRKMMSTAVIGSAVAIVCWALQAFDHLSIPAPVPDAAVVILSALAGWLCPPGNAETVLPAAAVAAIPAAPVLKVP